MTQLTEDHYPYLTSTVPGIGGRIRVLPEDFQVKERPLYLPCGEGEHLYIRVTKRQLATPQLVSYLASRLGIRARSVGVAGLKDAQAVSTQVVSLQGVLPEKVAQLHHEGILKVEVLGWHRNRLRTGHHAGNAFEIVVRDISQAAKASVPLILEELSRRGVPNFFGPQRQGRRGGNYQVGAQLLVDSSRRAKMPKSKRLWYLNAFQAFLFNRVLALRIDRIDRLLSGDWAMKHINGACFSVADPAQEQARVDAFEISPTGPLFGSRAPWATAEAGALEMAVVADLGHTKESLRQAAAACRFRGERRPLRVPLTDLDWSLERNSLMLAFTLPPGAYATSVLREIMKTGIGGM